MGGLVQVRDFGVIWGMQNLKWPEAVTCDENFVLDEADILGAMQPQEN